MGRRRDQEDVFKPLDDSPTDEVEEPQRSGRGWEIKIGLLALVLVVGATGYVAYTKLDLDDEADTAAVDSSRLQLDADTHQTVNSPVVPAVGEPETEGDGRPLVMTQWNDVSDSMEPAEVGAWTASESVAAQVPQAIEAAPRQPYSASYGGDSRLQAPPSTESTFAPVPNPDGFTATAAPMPADEAAAPGTTVAGNASVPTETAQPTAIGQYAPDSANPQPAQAASDFSPAPQSNYPPASSMPLAESPSTPAYTPPGQSYAPAPTYTPPEQETYAAEAMTAAPAYADPSTASPQRRESYEPYASPTTSRTPAGYAGLSGSGAPEAKPGAEAWQQPSVTAVDGKYTAQPNDNFYTISKKVYGSGAYFDALAKHNKDKYPKANQIRIGDVVQVPPVETLEGRYPELCPKPEHRDAAKRRSAAGSNRALTGRRVYVVQEGDNLFDIARFELGARAKVADLIELNRDVLADHINYLTPGMHLVLPEADTRGPAVTQRPTNALR